jgi:transcriptional regulator with XRE-family HTH domain
MTREVDAERGRRLKEARLREDMTHLELAVAAEVAIRTISDIENGYRNANRATWRALEQVLGPIPATPKVKD